MEIPEFPVLRGEKAIEALYDFIDELEEQRGKELTEKQIHALIKLTKGLISSIEAETQSGSSHKNTKHAVFAPAFAHSPMLFSGGATPHLRALMTARLI